MAMSSRTGRHAPRSKTGCSTCRIRKVKCDEQQPTCSRCSNARIQCDWNLPVPPRRTVANHSVKRKDRVLLQPAVQKDEVEDDVIDCEALQRISDHDPELRQSLALYKHSSDIILPPSLAVESIEMPNSLILDTQDLKAFQYVPESIMVRKFGKPWRWSMLSYIHSKVAPRESGVMSAFIAVASMELRFRDLVQYSSGVVTQTSLVRAVNLRNSASKFFQMALKQLCLLLDQITNREPSPQELEALFSMWFLILHCELYDPELIHASQIHLNGIRSFITKYLHGENGIGARELPPAAQQLLLFITYLDVNLALGNLNGGQLCLDLMAKPRGSPLFYDRIWEASRLCLPKLWGQEYPPEEILDDVENYRGLSFIQAAQKLKLSVWQLAVATGKGRDVDESRIRLWTRLEEIGDEFTDLLFLAKVVQNSGGRRVLFTVYHACLDYYAVKVLYSCLDESHASPDWLDKTLTSLLEVAHKAIGEDPQQIYRISWPLAVALLKVQDPIHRDWIQAQLTKARILLSDVGLPARLLDGPSPPKNVFLEYHQKDVIDKVP